MCFLFFIVIIILITVYIRDIRELRISVENELKESEEEAEMLADSKLRLLSSIFSSIIHSFHLVQLSILSFYVGLSIASVK